VTYNILTVCVFIWLNTANPIKDQNLKIQNLELQAQIAYYCSWIVIITVLIYLPL
jgi:hypothetical protein